MEEQQQYPAPEAQVKVLPGRPILLDCPKCSHFISSAEIDLETETASCSDCGHDFSFNDQLKKDPHRRPEVIIPDSVDALRLQSMLEIVVDWYRSSAKRTVIHLVSGTFFWNLLLIPLVLFLIYQGSLFFALLMGGHVITGIFLLIQLLAIFFNKTHIKVDKSGIRISHSPINNILNKPKNIPVEEIKQLYVVRYTQKYNPKDKRGIQAYALFVILKNNKRVELLRGMNRESQLYLEQEIETYLGIQDSPVRGEVPRSN